MTFPISFLLGAGFSAPFGIPPMTPFLDSFKTVAKLKYPHLYETLLRHFEQLEETGDLEALLSSLGKGERLLEAAPPNAQIPQEFSQWAMKSRYLKSHLIAYIIERCEHFEEEAAKSVLGPFLDRLEKSAAIDIIHLFTTNYDRIVEQVCQVTGVKVADGFVSSANELVAPWRRQFDEKVRLYKLHGSVSYYVDRANPNSPVFLRLDRGYPLPGPEFKLSRDGKDLEPLMVLPTLEKDALGDPYGYLNHLFAETLSLTRLLVVVGSSLRDNHLVSAINYSADSIVVLVIDSEPGKVAARIPDVRCIQLRGDALAVLGRGGERLMELLEGLDSEVSVGDLMLRVEDFASRERAILSEQTSLSEEVETAVRTLKMPTDVSDALDAIGKLRGIGHEEVVNAVGGKSSEENAREVRKAAASCLGLSGSGFAVEVLGNIARGDPCADVRLESYLALEAIGGEEGREALRAAREKWPQDSYFHL